MFHKHHYGTCRTLSLVFIRSISSAIHCSVRLARPINPPASLGALVLRIKLPEKVRVRLLRQHFSNQPRGLTEVEALSDNLYGRDPNLAPAPLDQLVDARAVDVLLEACPADGRGAHRAALCVGVECQVGKGAQRRRGLQLVGAVGVRQDG